MRGICQAPSFFDYKSSHFASIPSMKLINLFFLSLLQTQAIDPSSGDTMQRHAHGDNTHSQMGDSPGNNSSPQTNMTVPFNSTTTTVNILAAPIPSSGDSAASDSATTGDSVASTQSNSTTADAGTQSSQAASSDQSKHKGNNMTIVASTDSSTTYLIPTVSVFLVSLIASAY
ncbi:hypothetical protein DSO57_1011209 [Entomophthora muscae]|uniref:Uncharacterized protein n=1 Tax=Entomophthora muscae TaxID=34485 RepID=A0ACC2RLC7_9FUNG|nr:hypothetical protein DSO57_1011209 [Entomophthora muscae]